MIKTSPPTKTPEANVKSDTLPPWVIAGVIGAALLLVALIGWHTFQAVSGPSRPDLPVHAGMYNLRQEIQKGAAAKPGTGKSAP